MIGLMWLNWAMTVRLTIENISVLDMLPTFLTIVWIIIMVSTKDICGYMFKMSSKGHGIPKLRLRFHGFINLDEFLWVSR